MLDSASLEAIALEARNCFLYEDSPEYLGMLTEGISQLQELFNSSESGEKLTNTYKDLGRAAHSIKGGAGMAEMPTVSKLAHKIEDIFEALEQNRITDKNTTLQLLSLGIEELENLVEAEVNGQSTENNENAQELILALNEFLTTLQDTHQLTEIGFADSNFIKTSLTIDLDACIERVEEIINDPNFATEENINDSLKILEDECTLLGQALNCDWLVNLATNINSLREKKSIKITKLATLSIQEIKHQREQFLTQEGEAKIEYSPEFKRLFPQEKFTVKLEKTTLPEKNKTQQLESQTIAGNLRIPIDKVTRISDIVGELLIYHERLQLYENQIKEANLNLKKRTQSLFPLKEQVEFLYDQLTVTEEVESLTKSSNKLTENRQELAEFDALEFDEYTQVHSTLQGLTELIVQIQEVREDFELVSRELQETLITMRQSLDTLDQDLTQVRLIPFINLAGSFINPINKLNKKYNKSVNLVIEGEQVLIDQTIIENLRTPFVHIIRNAFDHGIESSKKRDKLGKSKNAQIKLSAKLEGNNVIMMIADDGAGINIDKVYQKALSLGLFPPNTNPNQFTKEQILEFIFSPGFSTAQQVSDLSGRGMGMDIVKAEIEKLKGTIKVTTKANQGTEFQLKIPMALNIISLLLVKVQQQTLAFPSDKILRIIRLSDYEIKAQKITGEEELIPVYYLYQILPYNTDNIFDFSPEIPTPNIGLLLNLSGDKIFLAVDSIVDEKQLVSKSFDDTIPTPAYIAGCTVLGSGEVVPIFVPDYLKPLITNLAIDKKPENPQIIESKTISSDKVSILIIDDSIAVRRTLNRILTQIGYQVTQCRDGKEAWNTLLTTNQDFNLAICDLEMPGFDGYKVLQLIRTSETWHNLPVIILTSRENDLHRQKAMDLGANAYMTKPFHPVKMLETIEMYLLQ